LDRTDAFAIVQLLAAADYRSDAPIVKAQGLIDVVEGTDACVTMRPRTTSSV